MSLIDKYTLIFPHVPKCGGTTIQTQIEKLPLKVFLDYDNPPSSLQFHKKKCEKRNKDYSLLDFSNFDLVFGHFPIERYASSKYSDKYKYVALCRDPYQRIVSQLNYLVVRRKNGVNLAPGAAKMADKLITGEVTPYDWVRNSKMQFTYREYLSHWDKENFVLVGDMNSYCDFVDGLNLLLGGGLNCDETARKMIYDDDIVITSDEEAKIKKALVDEYEWYNDFISMK